MPYKSAEDKKDHDGSYAREWYRRNRAEHIAYVAIQNKRLRAQLRDWVDQLKLAAGCARCDYRKHPSALDFHHVSDDKVISITEAVGRQWSKARLLKEIAKCECICANCHREITWSRRARLNSTGEQKAVSQAVPDGFNSRWPYQFWRCHLTARMPDFHSGNEGSTPFGATTPSSFNGRTAAFGAAHWGSIPWLGAKVFRLY